MKNESALADLLGIAPYASGAIPQSEMVARINAGLPIGAVARVATAVAPDDRTFAFHLVKRATLHRRRSASKGDATLSALKGAKVVRVARVWEMACEVWKDDDAARDFLHRPHPLLEGGPRSTWFWNRSSAAHGSRPCSGALNTARRRDGADAPSGSDGLSHR